MKINIPYSERVGEKINMLTIVKLTGTKYSGRAVKQLCVVQCECGNEKEITIDSVTSRGVKSCGCAKRTRGNSALSRTYGRYKSGANQRNYSFSLSREDFESLVTSKCHYCGVEPSTLAEYNNHTFVYNGIDRVDNSLGYEIGNVVTCCITCNRAKHNLPYDEFMSWIRGLIKWQS